MEDWVKECRTGGRLLILYLILLKNYVNYLVRGKKTNLGSSEYLYVKEEKKRLYGPKLSKILQRKNEFYSFIQARSYN